MSRQGGFWRGMAGSGQAWQAGKSGALPALGAQTGVVTRRIGYSGLGAYASSACHYCGRHATTDDHVVPRSAFPMHQSALPQWFRWHNVAPSCSPCNGFKEDYRSDCECAQCCWVWTTALALFLPPGYRVRVRRVIKVGQSRL